ncbi:hypothetical protein [Thermoactinomyces sp. CICC 10521]|uniref:hypothetical protein n=1 Tax=Thermoactinomyces sp. CICC 10521 TaxID=2767426 RepID=UPI0018DBE866|nr:hypothetical protein [Thermoactinomyces sp. CICC 10521]MBH8608770.1 hypothetical protein [Thermoactinomyces sp. CICC 10521]
MKKIKKRQPLITRDIRLAVWESEDGRCEVCKRPMDRKVAYWLPVNPDTVENKIESLHLACVDCANKRPDFLLAIIKVKPRVLRRLQARLQEVPDNLEEWFALSLRDYGVVLRFSKKSREYWLPGIGTFFLRSIDEENGFPVREVFKAVTVYPNGKLTIKSQERTRGLPRPVLRLS